VTLSLDGAAAAIRGLGVLAPAVHDDPCARALLRLLDRLGSPASAAGAGAPAGAAPTPALAAAAAADGLAEVADAWAAHLALRVVETPTAWSAAAERGAVPAGLARAAERDLSLLGPLAALGEAVQAVTAARVGPELAPTAWRDLAPGAAAASLPPGHALAARLARSADWSGMARDLERLWSVHGTGPALRHRALRWAGERGALVPVVWPDPVSLDDLCGCERQRERLSENLDRFVRGGTAHDMLLYGPAGTGKSSMVKALAQAYAPRGLRLVEVAAARLSDLPAIAAAVRGRAPRFLLFVDDLSFAAGEAGYRPLKTVLEGGAEARPNNLLVCATSNRRHLVAERMADRADESDDAAPRDALEERISLASRFGLRVTFFAPDQAGFLAIVRHLAARRRLAVAPAELEARALLWQRSHAGRSGRLARQFVDELAGEASA
jgi:predicted AAA+ superfamily ATPase